MPPHRSSRLASTIFVAIIVAKLGVACPFAFAHLLQTSTQPLLLCLLTPFGNDQFNLAEMCSSLLAVVRANYE